MTNLQRTAIALGLGLLMVLVSLASITHNEYIEEPIIESLATEGRQIEADCEGISFEDMFYYNYAEFTIDVDDTWDGGTVKAAAYVNGSDSAVLRGDLDGLFEGLPGGDNGWLSTDERDGVEAVGKDCVVQTYTRLGFRGGPSHRGGQGVNWNNATWDEAGMTLEEENLIPEGHPERRSCQDQFGGPSGSPSCEEIPNGPGTANGCGPTGYGSTGCNTVIYLNATVSFDPIFDPSNFTMGIVGTNLSNAVFTFTYPSQSQPLRISETFESQDCDVSYTEDDEEADDYGVTYTPQESCETYTSTNEMDYSLTAVSNGVQFQKVFTYDGGDWPALREYFIDFTTSPPPVDDPPQWRESAPADGDIIPIAGLGEEEPVLDVSDVLNWFSDEMGAGLLDVDCTGGSGWSLTEASNNNWVVTSPGSGTTTITCQATDSAGQVSGERTYTVAPIMSVSAPTAETLDSLVVVLTPTSNAPSEMDVKLTLIQGPIEIESDIDVDGSETTATLSVGELSPGAISLRVVATGAGMAAFDYEFDLGLAKLSLPPTVQISGSEWIDANFILRGYFSDPDGEPVSFTLSIDGVNQGQVQVTGNSWETDEIPFDLLVEGEHTVTVEACDSSGECFSVEQVVDNTFLFEVVDTLPPVIADSSEEESGGLPGPGAAFAVLAMLGAGLVLRRRE